MADGDVVDVEGTPTRWLDGIGADFVILRPDFYVAPRPQTLRSCGPASTPSSMTSI
jgi:hypothetical protein